MAPWRAALCLLALGVAVFAAGCANRPINPPLAAYDPTYGYRVETANLREGSDRSTIMALAFSGGGTRAAAFAYGVLEELRRTPIIVDGTPRRLIDEIDILTGVSGGSFTALAYTQRGERLFDDFPERFLYRDVQGDLIARALAPWQWGKLASTGWGRSELAADYYDEILFDGATFGDLVGKPTPRAIVTGTDISTGARFGFTQGDFDVICSDLSKVRLARAAATSSAVPVLLSPVTFNNYAGTCGLYMPLWVQQRFSSGAAEGAAARVAERHREISLLEDSVNRPYLHIVDGGISDNLGLRAILEGLEELEVSEAFRKFVNMRNFRRVVVIVVNARSAARNEWDRSETGPGMLSILLQSAGVPIDRYSSESLEHLKRTVDRWNARRETDALSERLFGSPDAPRTELALHAIDLSFDKVADPTERDYLMGLPTSFVLPREAVDRLREAAATLLRDSAAYRALVRDLGGDLPH